MRKYESDLTRKEKRQMEIEKLKQMTFPEKLSHMWSYHKLILFLPILLLILVIGTIRWIENSRYEIVLTIGVVNSIIWDMDDSTLESLREQMGVQDRHSEVLIDIAYTFVDGQVNFESEQKLAVTVASQALDVFIINQQVYDDYHYHDMFMDLSNIFSEEELAGMQIINGNAIDISAAIEINETYFGVVYQPIYFTVIANVDLDGVNQEGMTKRELIRRLYQELYGFLQ